MSISTLVFCSALVLAADAGGKSVDFERDVASILVRRCVECHQEQNKSGGLALTSQAGLLAGGENGQVVVPGSPEASHLLERVLAGEMPPEKQGRPQKLPEGEAQVLRRWIESGAAWPAGRVLSLFDSTSDVRAGRDWWSLQPVRRPEVPEVAAPAGTTNPIDAFIWDVLQRNGLEPAPIADRRTLMRRVYYDVIGLPPTHAEMEAFVADDAPDAWARLVDKLLDSPHFGERWARHWLDAVRFAETSGYERDQPKPFAWKYRDWVVKAVNTDKPFDRFILEQLAGDELPDRTEETVIATGFLRLGTWNDEPNDPQDYKYERLEDLVHATSSAFLGFTVKCARCHDHKFDPIPQTDYYRMAAAFWPGPIEPRDRNLLGGPTDDELGSREVLGWTDVNKSPEPLHLLKSGDRQHPLQVVEPASLSFAPANFRAFDPPAEAAKTSGRRLQLARWIAQRDNPLTSRVIVNRLWQQHFGAGLVRSPNNFGFTGDRPTHPELLDWLADELLRGGWKLKPLHRLILTSQTYRMASLHPRQAEYAQQDAGNRTWWLAERRRLDAESLRDSMLAVSGELDLQLGGPSFFPTINPEALEGLSRKAAAWQASPPEQQRRRSLYIFTQRSLLPPFMTTFDFADTTLPCAQRDVTTVAPQALALLNNSFVHERSAALAQRVIEAAGDDPSAQVVAAWKLALGRSPAEDEWQIAAAHLESQRRRFEQLPAANSTAQPTVTPQSQALTSLCHVLLNSNEFLYID